jgi:hypothetical protein
MESESRTITVVPPQAAEDLFNTLSALPPLIHCPKCGFKLLHLDATFFSQNGKVWTLPLPVCPKCDLKQDAARVTQTAA